MIICEEEGIGTDEYEDILYDDLFSLIDNLLESLNDSETIRITNENTFLFMQDNAPCYKSICVLEFLEEYHVPIIE